MYIYTIPYMTRYMTLGNWRDLSLTIINTLRRKIIEISIKRKVIQQWLAGDSRPKIGISQLRIRYFPKSHSAVLSYLLLVHSFLVWLNWQDIRFGCKPTGEQTSDKNMSLKTIIHCGEREKIIKNHANVYK